MAMSRSLGRGSVTSLRRCDGAAAHLLQAGDHPQELISRAARGPARTTHSPLQDLDADADGDDVAADTFVTLSRATSAMVVVRYTLI